MCMHDIAVLGQMKPDIYIYSVLLVHQASPGRLGFKSSAVVLAASSNPLANLRHTGPCGIHLDLEWSEFWSAQRHTVGRKAP